MIMQPTRSSTRLKSGQWIVKVTPPEWAGFKSSNIVLSESQYERFCEWLQGGSLLQQALPDLTPAEREVLLTGICSDEWEEHIVPEDN